MIKNCLSKITVWVCMFLALAGFTSVSLAAKTGQEYLSPLALVADKDGKNLYVAEATAKQVAVFDLTGNKPALVISLSDSPSGLVLAPDGSRLYVTGASHEGRLHIVNLQTGKVCCTLPAGHTPMAPVVRPDGKTLYVCNRFSNNVSVFDLVSRKEVAKIPVMREPVAAAITPDGNVLFVANYLPAGSADGDYTAAVVSVIDTVAKKVSATELRQQTSPLCQLL